eukprot:1767584-Rhodomonas_salina.1
MAMPELDHSWLSELREWDTKSPQLHSFLWGPHSQGKRTEEGSAVQSWDSPRGHVISSPHLPYKGGAAGYSESGNTLVTVVSEFCEN